MPSPLTIYLRNHEAAANAGHDLFCRASKAQRTRPYAAELRALTADVRADLLTLRRILKRLKVRRSLLQRLGLQSGERLGRLKPNGGLVRRAPLSDLIEVEGMRDAVHAKAAAWQAMTAAGLTLPEVATLAARADDQLGRLNALHRRVAADVLPGR